MKIDQYISELLYEHDCVVVPSFGGFVTNPAPSRLERAKHRISPPRKEISFNANLTKNDGLLTTHIAKIKSINYDEAVAFIRQAVLVWNDDLNNIGRVDVENVGILYKTKGSNNIRFEPDNVVNYLLDSFGLEPCNIYPVATLARPKKTRIDRLSVKPSEHTRINRLIPYTIAIIPFIIYLLWLPLSTDILNTNGNFTYSDLNPFTKKKCPVYSMREFTSQHLMETKLPELHKEFICSSDSASFCLLKLSSATNPDIADLTIQVRLKKPVIAKVESTYVKPVKPKKKFRFYIIGGCFKIKGNANRLLKKFLKSGYSPLIVDIHNGLYRVAFKGYQNHTEAIEALKKIRQDENPKAWLLSK